MTTISVVVFGARRCNDKPIVLQPLFECYMFRNRVTVTITRSECNDWRILDMTTSHTVVINRTYNMVW